MSYRDDNNALTRALKARADVFARATAPSWYRVWLWKHDWVQTMLDARWTDIQMKGALEHGKKDGLFQEDDTERRDR